MATSNKTAASQPGGVLGVLDRMGDGIWRALNSLPVAIGVMLVLAILSALGTIIPQEHLLSGMDQMNPQGFYIQRYGESRYNLIHGLGLTHVYFTPYFFILMVWLSISAVVCNITRFRRTMKMWKTPPAVRGRKSYQADKRAVVLDVTAQQAQELVQADLEHHRFRVRLATDEDGTQHVYGDRGFMKKWALVVLHFALIVLLFGAVYGKIYGVEGWIRLNDGQKDTLTLDVRANKRNMVQWMLTGVKPLTFNLSQDRFRIDYDKHLVLPKDLQGLDPELQEYYSYFVKQFVSVLTVERNGRTKVQEVSVNHPLVMDRLVLYQSGYGQQGELRVSGPNGEKDYPVPAGQWLVLTAEGPALAEQVLPTGVACGNVAFNLEQIKAGDLYVRSEKSGTIGPLTIAHLADVTGNREWSQLLSGDKSFTTQIGDVLYKLSLGPHVSNYSEFSYKRDPGIPILYLGWITLILGIAVSLYIPYTQVWLRIEPGRIFMLSAGPGGARAAHAHYGRWRDMLSKP